MKVIVTNSYDETCAVIANMIKELVNAKPDAKLGLATGGTPVPIYKKLIEMNKAGEVDFSRVHTVNLDEYCGIPGTHDQSYRYFMDTNLFDHINIDKKNTFVASGMGDILAAKKVVLAATGLAKVPAIKGLIMDDVITTQNPSTMLKMHDDAVVVIDRELADAVGYRA